MECFFWHPFTPVWPFKRCGHYSLWHCHQEKEWGDYNGATPIGDCCWDCTDSIKKARPNMTTEQVRDECKTNKQLKETILTLRSKQPRTSATLRTSILDLQCSTARTTRSRFSRILVLSLRVSTKSSQEWTRQPSLARNPFLRSGLVHLAPLRTCTC